MQNHNIFQLKIHRW